MPGIGTLVLLESASDGAGGLRANALRVEVTDPQAAAVIGQPFVIGHLDLSAIAGQEAPPPPATTAPAPTAPPASTAPADEPATTAPRAGTTTAAPEPAPPLAATPQLGLPRRPVPKVALPDDQGYVFPVLGDVSFSDDYGAPRAGTGWHHGNDLFAERGTPVLAVADGTLSRVGVNTLGGNRLWLTDEAGNEFYYAHLSAYAPATVSGARVTAGQVIAFVGNTGQAITTPPHLHFEVHPSGGDSVEPLPVPRGLAARQRDPAGLPPGRHLAVAGAGRRRGAGRRHPRARRADRARLGPGRPGQLAGVSRGRRPRSRRGPRRCARPAAAPAAP